jgi:transposase
MLTAVYFMLRDGLEYHDLGQQYFARGEKDPIAKRLLQRLLDLGVNVEVNVA